MRNFVLVGNLTLALASLFAVPSCVDGVDDGGDLDVGTTEASLWSNACPSGTPAALAPQANQDLSFVLDATGVQKYACTATATGAAWTFVAPYADMFTHCGEPAGIHYGGPAWEYEDGSIAFGAKVAGVTVNPTAVPWLLLSVVSHSGDSGKMDKVTAVQRLATTGGNAPATGCDVAHLGATADVPYTAKYFFYRTRTYHSQYNTRCGA
jgi:hypothetical protein